MSSARDSLMYFSGLFFFFSKVPQMSNFMKIRSVVNELFHADGRKDRHDEANSRISKFCERAIETRDKS
jgi:hypothetical protein